MPQDEDLKNQIEKLQEDLKKTHEESIILYAVLRALKKLEEKRGIKKEQEQITDLEEQLKNL